MRARALVLSLLCLSAAGCAPETKDVSWRVLLPDGGAAGAVTIHADVRQDNCFGSVAFSYDVVLSSGATRGMTQTTKGGTWCICAEARDAMCRPVASVCEQVNLPSATTIDVVLQAAPTTQPSACATTCTAGLCAADAGISDGGVRDLPSMDAPATDLPSVDMPVADAPGSDAPAVDMPAVDMSGTDLGTDAGTDLGTDAGVCTGCTVSGGGCELGVTADACGELLAACVACSTSCGAGVCRPPGFAISPIAWFLVADRAGTPGVTSAGADTYSQRGDRTFGMPFGVDTMSSAVASSIYALGVTQFATCATTTAGELYCWGRNYYGLLARSSADTTVLTSTPTLVTGFGSNWALIDGGSQHFCAIRTTGALECWGDNAHGQLGLSGATRTGPTRVGADAWLSVSAGDVNTCAIRADHSLWCWGDDTYGQVGDGTTSTTAVSAPSQVGTATDWIAISVEGTHPCGIRETDGAAHTGSLWCWGDERNGQLGLGTVSGPQTTPQRVMAATDWTSVSAGQFHTCGLRGASAYCWGGSAFGELGDGTTSTQLLPELLGGTWSAITAGWHMSCGVQTGGAAGAYCWGSNAGAKLGIAMDPATTMYVFSPTPVM